MKLNFQVIFFIVLFITVSSCAYAQLLNSENLYGKVILLKSRSNHGSGFILSFKDNFYLVTAKHVADSLHWEDTKLIIKDKNNKALIFDLKQLMSINPFRKFDDKSDFFILQIVPYNSIIGQIFGNASFPLDKLVSDRNSISRQYDLVVMGFPIYDLEHFSPISFRSNISSSLMNISVANSPKPCYCYLLEHPGMQGFSGGPVLIGVQDRMIYPINETLIMGLVTGTTYDKTGGKFAIITPAFHLIDLINN
jgi:hypothetical protein